jgi:hypothetical protein
MGYPTYDLYRNRQFVDTLSLSVVGMHNVLNSLGCVALCDYYGITIESIKEGLKNYTGAARRFEYKGELNSAKVYDDYGVTTENEWVKTKLPSSEADDQWLGLNDYIFELEEEKMESGTKYSGIINLKKIFGLLEKFDLPIDFAGFMDKDVDITVIVNNDNYIEKMNMSFEVLGVKMVIDLNYYDYNKIGDVVIPDEVLKAKEN